MYKNDSVFVVRSVENAPNFFVEHFELADPDVMEVDVLEVGVLWGEVGYELVDGDVHILVGCLREVLFLEFAVVPHVDDGFLK